MSQAKLLNLLWSRKIHTKKSSNTHPGDIWEDLILLWCPIPPPRKSSPRQWVKKVLRVWTQVHWSKEIQGFVWNSELQFVLYLDLCVAGLFFMSDEQPCHTNCSSWKQWANLEKWFYSYLCISLPLWEYGES